MLEPFCLLLPVPPGQKSPRRAANAPHDGGATISQTRATVPVPAGRDDPLRDRDFVKRRSNFLPLAAFCKCHSNCPSFLEVFLALV